MPVLADQAHSLRRRAGWFNSSHGYHAALAQLERAPTWYVGGREFESLRWLHADEAQKEVRPVRTGKVARSIRVIGSITPRLLDAGVAFLKRLARSDSEAGYCGWEVGNLTEAHNLW